MRRSRCAWRCLFCAAEPNQRLPARFCGIEPGANACVRVQRDVALQLGAEIGFPAVTPHKIAEAVSKMLSVDA